VDFRFQIGDRKNRLSWPNRLNRHWTEEGKKTAGSEQPRDKLGTGRQRKEERGKRKGILSWERLSAAILRFERFQRL
jgi:hypothetical protein